jgi:hypothetical protein
LIPPGLVDIFVIEGEGQALSTIMHNDINNMEDVPNTIIYRDSGYHRCEKKAPGADGASGLVDFDGFDLKEYGNLKLPLTWEK